MHDLVVTDDKTGLSRTIDIFDPGQSTTIQTSYTLTQADLTAGTFVNTATAAAPELSAPIEAAATITMTSPSETPTTDPATTTPSINAPPPTVLGTETTSPVVSGIIAVGGADSDFLLIIAAALVASGFAWRLVSRMTELVPLRAHRKKTR